MFLIKKTRSTDVHFRTVTLSNGQKQPPEVFYEKAARKNFAVFTGKRMH